jgi:erythromycin esterase
MVDDQTVGALREHAVSIDPAGDQGTASTLPDVTAHSFDDARIVGLGEATHGTRECFLHKHRLIRHLVLNEGFRTVAFEADAAAVAALDAFGRDGTVREPPDDAASALTELDMWQWRTESVRELLEWVRAFNDGRARDEQVRIRGVDLTSPSAPAAPLRDYLETVAPGIADSDAFRTIEDATVPDDAEERERTLDAVIDAAADLRDGLETHRESHEADDAAVSADAWDAAHHRCRVVEQAAAWARIRHEQPGPHPDGMAARDRFMAENALWALERDPGNGVALWAHDGHVQRGTFDDGTIWADATTMGERLARELGEGYRPIGFDFASGSFRAVGRESGEVGTFAVDDPREDSATAAFAAVGDAPFLLDVDSAAADNRLGPLLDEDRRKRYVGSVFDPAADEAERDARTDLAASFDWLLFLPESTPTVSVEGRGQNP